MTVSTTFQIRLIRNKDSKLEDDVLTVKKTFALGFYDMTYKDPVNNLESTTTISENNLFQYFVSLFDTLYSDQDPFQFIQLSFPFFPCLLLKTSNLGSDSLRRNIQSMLNVTLRCWSFERENPNIITNYNNIINNAWATTDMEDEEAD